MGQFLLLAVVLSSAFSQAVYDSCLSVSAGPGYTNQLAAVRFGDFGSLSLQAALNMLWPVLQKVTSPYLLNMQVGLSNGDFFAIKSCQTLDALYYGSACWSPSVSTPYAFYARSMSLFGDGFRRVYAVTNTGAVGALMITETATFNTTGRAWYLCADYAGVGGWCPEFIGFGTNTRIRTYAVPIQGTVLNGVVGWDRPYRETCDKCISNSEAFTAIAMLTKQNLYTACGGVTTAAGVQACWTALFNAYKQANRGYLVNLFLGLYDGSFYIIETCAYDQATITKCPAAGRPPYIAWAVNRAVYNDNNPHMFALSSAGVAGTTDFAGNAGMSSYFDPRQRPWYVIGTGVTDPFTVAYSGSPGVVGRAASQVLLNTASAYNALNNTWWGVASSYISQLEPCLGFQPPPCMSPNATLSPSSVASVTRTPIPASPSPSTTTSVAPYPTNMGPTQSFGASIAASVFSGISVVTAIVFGMIIIAKVGALPRKAGTEDYDAKL